MKKTGREFIGESRNRSLTVAARMGTLRPRLVHYAIGAATVRERY